MSSVNKEVDRYVREERESGTPEEAIRHALLARGWEYHLIETALIKSRPSSVRSLFNPTFFRFALGFIVIIMISVAVILITGSLANGGAQGEVSGMAQTQR